MDKLNTYREIIRRVLKEYIHIHYANAQISNRAAFDPETDEYLIISEGWNEQKHLHSF